MDGISSSFRTSAENVFLNARTGSVGNTAFALKSFYQQGIQSPIEAKNAFTEAILNNHEMLCEKNLAQETGWDINLVKKEGLGVINHCIETIQIWIKIKKAQFQQGNYELKKQFEKALKLAQKNIM